MADSFSLVDRLTIDCPGHNAQQPVALTGMIGFPLPPQDIIRGGITSTLQQNIGIAKQTCVDTLQLHTCNASDHQI